MPSVLRAPRGAVLLALVLPFTACLESTREIDWVDESPTAVPSSALADSAPGAMAPLTAEVRADGLVTTVALEGERARSAALLRLLRDMPAAQERRAAGAPLPVVETAPAPDRSMGEEAVPVDAQRCDGSVRLVSTVRGDVAAWWSERPGRRVHLLVAWRDKGQATWRGPIPVDTLDVGSTDARDVPNRVATGCARPAPGLSVDGENGYVHVAYALVGPEGPGFFYAHQMDPRAAFEPPIPIVYGERLGAARVASDGDAVAVVYEDPNSGTRPRIAIAVSRTAGHLFERRVTVNAGLNPASDPYVAIAGAALAVGWSEAPPAGGDTVFLVRRAIIR
jgi:hypothetical protein